jgi:GT2 family glycosyltransferase
MSNRPVIVGYVHGGTVRAEFMDSMLNAISGPEASEAIGGVISSTAGPLLAFGRNLLAGKFLKSDKEWLCSIDTDIVFSTDAIDRLLNSADPVERPIVSALYYIFNDKGRKVPAALLNKEPDLELYPITLSGNDGIVRVMATGAGFLLIHRRVFEDIMKKASGHHCWFDEMVVNRSDVGEDVSFCLRAALCGFPVYVNTDIKVGHVKYAMLGEVN